MKRLRKFVIGTLALSIMGLSSNVFADTYVVQSGDTYWKIAQKYEMSVSELLKVNNANEKNMLLIGDKIIVPDKYYEVKQGDTAWIISQKLNVSIERLFEVNNIGKYSIIYPGQKLIIPNSVQKITKELEQPKVNITYDVHTIKSGDNFWILSMQYGIPMYEILNANNMTENTQLQIGQKVKIPVHNVAVMETMGSQYGEYLDWWSGVQYVIPNGAVIKITDYYSGKSFMAKRTIGANHADTETLTANDTKIMKEIWGGTLSWDRRPVIVEYNGRKIAGSAAGMPHAGNEEGQGGYYTSWRSGGYGAGMNFDYVKGNDMDGHFDLHFLNSTRHKDGKIDEKHQANIKIAAGIK